MKYFAILFTVFILGCSKNTKQLPAGLQYFPDIDLLKEGIVSKFYYHKGKKTAQPKTDIVYRKMVLKDNIIIYEDYNAGFQKTYLYELEIDNNQWKFVSQKSFHYRNNNDVLMTEYSYTFKNNIHTDWEENEASYEKSIMYDGQGSRVLNRQIEILDTIDQGNKVKLIYAERSFFSTDDEDTELNKLKISKRYEAGLGLTQTVMNNDEYNYNLVLDEIMTVDEFEQRADHGTHRVAYIDTLKTIDDHTQFQPCFHPAKINDYYNGNDSGFKGGKGRLWALLNDKLNPLKIEGESGYLTFRFVVNCNGEAGWFVTEEAGMDYQKKQFSDKCRNHLYDILKAEKEWNNLKIGHEDRDAYTYITFKIKNGEIIELLP